MRRPALIVTGTHYSGTTILAQVVSDATALEILYEPFSPRKRSSYSRNIFPEFYMPLDFLPESDWGAQVRELFLDPYAIMRAEVRDFFDILLLPLKIWRKRRWSVGVDEVFILKDPFVSLASKSLVDMFDCDVAVTFRDPRAFASSVLKRAERIEYADAAVWTDESARIRDEFPEYSFDFSTSAADQAILCYRVVYGHLLKAVPPDKAHFINLSSLPPRSRSSLATLEAALKLRPGTLLAQRWRRSNDVRSTIPRGRRPDVRLPSELETKVAKCCATTFQELMAQADAAVSR